jgi:hypothetical protein
MFFVSFWMVAGWGRITRHGIDLVYGGVEQLRAGDCGRDRHVRLAHEAAFAAVIGPLVEVPVLIGW